MKNVEREFRKRYWLEFSNTCKKNDAPLKPHKSSGDANAIDVNLGPNLKSSLDHNFRIAAVLSATGIPGYAETDNIAIRISVTKEFWDILKEEWSDINSKFDDNELQHRQLDEKGNFPNGQQIFLYKEDTDVTNERDWHQQFKWFILNLWKFAEIFRKLFCPSLEPFDQPFERGKISRTDDIHSEENTNTLIEALKQEIEFLDNQITHLNRRKSELQSTLSNYE